MGTSAVRRVGIVGLGKMGHPMARHLARAKFEVTGYDIDPHTRSQAQGSGIVLAANPRAVAERSDFVIIVVGFDSEAEAVLLGRDGIAGAARPGLIVGVASTVAPSTMVRTSVPGPTPSASSASSSASVPEPTPIACATPQYAAIARSKRSMCGPSTPC